ncbi:NAD(P)/FAD-dependent oxidoreductase [Streptomyces sp. NRRL F-5755]|uniref:NAD(P)/FAD-dependent oxidoreductase n=1 Tax=Streptomyces sp. NRRL F-5755 TaxID=1519475 RepID=UPI0006AE4ED5|nr:FAD-dependent monooxygenase [Streptomyces sp. NRRL F-5755]
MTTRRNPHSPSAHSPTAVVLGGGLTGMLAAAVLATHAQVHIVERDVLPTSPAPRRGLPQAQHAHLLWSGGARTIESLLPGVTQRWLSAGARRIPLPTGLVSLTAQGWLRRWPEMQYLIACSRDLLDWGVRQQVLAHPGIRVLTRTEPVGLSGTAGHVTGVEVRDTATGDVQRLNADLVIDATGRGSAAATWLAALGLPPVTEKHVDSGLAYATRIFRAPAGTEHWPIVNVQSDASAPVPGQTATLVPLEEARWLVTLSGTRGGQPTREADAFLPFARNVRHPIVAELIADAEPLTDVRLSRSTVNRRRRFDLLRAWPRGFAVLGDAVATYNPLYGQGMSVAAQEAAALRDALDRYGLGDPGLAWRLQRTVGRLTHAPWAMATGQDIRYPDAVGPRPPAATRLLRGYTDRLLRTATGDPVVTRALLDVMTLSAPLQRLMRPNVAARVLLGPARPPLAVPPLNLPAWRAASGTSSQRSTGGDGAGW